jgi:hypothetical protein
MNLYYILSNKNINDKVVFDLTISENKLNKFFGLYKFSLYLMKNKRKHFSF